MSALVFKKSIGIRESRFGMEGVFTCSYLPGLYQEIGLGLGHQELAPVFKSLKKELTRIEKEWDWLWPDLDLMCNMMSEWMDEGVTMVTVSVRP